METWILSTIPLPNAPKGTVPLPASASFRKRPAGGANNPHGCKGKPEGEEINVDNIHVDLPERPTGNSAAAGLRKLQKAAAGNDTDD